MNHDTVPVISVYFWIVFDNNICVKIKFFTIKMLEISLPNILIIYFLQNYIKKI